ncbi:hypothetical protein [Brevundimonas nasdae]|uniref:hypothetical protein n=1 Tax=Brevundimonas nasdae TaxID=172043 RepID=UPI003F690C82
MTRVVAAIGCCPQKPLALVVVGGMLVAPVLILIVLAVMIDLFSRRLGPGIEPAALESSDELVDVQTRMTVRHWGSGGQLTQQARFASSRHVVSSFVL